MGKSREVQLTLLAAIALSMTACREERRDCVDAQSRLVPDAACHAGTGEWLLSEPFAQQALSTLPPDSALQEFGPRKDRRQWGSLLWIEPVWKMLWSNKALLAILWELNPGHELLLPAYLNGARELTSYVRKLLFGREGSGIAAVKDGVCVGLNLAKAEKAAKYSPLGQRLAA